MNQKVIEKFWNLLGKDRVLVDEPMKRHTTFRIGGPADFFLLPSTVDEVRGILEICREEELPYFILGNGSNLLVSDKGYRGVIIQLYRNFSNISVEGNEICASSGALLSQIAAAARNASLTGFEFAGGIPGTLGGAVFMNAGAYGGELKDVLKEAVVMTEQGEILTLPVEKLDMGYRTSRIKKAGYLVLEARLVLEQGDMDKIRDITKDLTEKRVSKQPLEYPSAGSVFKRPVGYFAGTMIEQCGLKGKTVGGAMVSPKHAGFIVNTGDATCQDVLDLISLIQTTVNEQTGIMLECEIRAIGG